MESNTARRGKTLKGVVVSDKMDKTVVVEVKRYLKYPKYEKYVAKSKRYKAHDPENKYREGDHVVIQETRPLAKDKTFIVLG